MKITVTQEDIDKGKRGSCLMCPIALAYGRITGRIGYVGTRTIRLAATPTRLELPPVAKTFIRDFDLNKPVEPFEFEVDL